MYGYIYKTTNLITKKIYIGQHKASKFEPNKYIGSGTAFKKDYKKFGKSNFICELLECCDSAEELNDSERYWISYYNAREADIGYNISEGGASSFFFTNCHHSEESKKIIGEYSRDTVQIHKDCVNKQIKRQFLQEYLDDGWQLGFVKDTTFNTEEYRNKISRSKKGKHYYTNGEKIVFIADDEILRYENEGYFPGQCLHDYYWMNFNNEDYKISREEYLIYKQKGYRNGRVTKGFTPQQRLKFSEMYKGKKGVSLTEEAKLKISKAHKGLKVDEATKKKISAGLKKFFSSEEGKELSLRTGKKALETRIKNGKLKHTEQTKKKLSEIKKINNPIKGTHPIKCVVMKNGRKKTISIKNVDKYLDDGYIKIK